MTFTMIDLELVKYLSIIKQVFCLL